MHLKNYVLFSLGFFLFTGIFAQKQIENLDRGLVAVRTSNSEVFLSWRMFITDPTNIGFNLYRGGTKVNDAPIISTTNFIDNTSANADYTIRPVLKGIEQEASKAVGVMNNNVLRVPLNKPPGGTTQDNNTYTYSANDASVGDVDGDGEYEIILKWEGLGKDNSQSGFTSNVLIDAYKLDGTQLWRIDLGRNIRSGAHYTQFMVYDLDGDGKAEVACKTAPNTKDGSGQFLSMGPAASDDDDADYRNGSGYVLSGPEYLTVFNGETGAEMATVTYIPARGNVSSWGDNYGNRVDRFLAGVGYFDGQRPSLLFARGYYTRTVLAVWDWRNGELTQRWVFDSNDPGNGGYASQGNHSLSINDVDSDGKDEVVYGSMAIDDDGTGLYTTGLGHGDAQHVGDLVPSRPGQESWSAHESPSQYQGNGLWLRDAGTGEKLWGVPTTGDVGRALSADIDPNYPGNEMWGSAGAGTYSSTGELISSSRPSYNHAIWWDGDLLRELLDDSKLDKWNPETKNTFRLFTVYQTGASSNNGSKANPGLTADVFGDWREEMIYRNSSSEELLVITSTIPTPYKFYTLMHDSQYRVSIAWQNTAYNQPPHTSFFLGANMNAIVSNGDDPSEILKTNASEGSPLNTALASLSSELAATDLSFEKVLGPEWLTISEEGMLTGTPQDQHKGLNRFSILVRTNEKETDLKLLEIEVADTNSPPQWTTSPINGTDALVGLDFSGSLADYATDPDSKISFTKVSGPEWLQVSQDGSLSGIPDPSDLGSNSFTVKVEDEEGAGAETTLVIEVVNLAFKHHYKLDNDTDDSQGQRHGVPFGNPAYSTGIVDEAMAFDGSNDYVSLPEGIANHQKITISTWVKWDGNSNYQRIFDFGDDTSNYMFLTPRMEEGMRFAIRTSSVSEQRITVPALPVGSWKHVAVVMDGASAKLYVDGMLAGENTQMTLAPSSLGNTQQNYIGESQWPDPKFNGSIDDFRIYNYPLSAEEILAIKNLEDTQLPVLKSNTAADGIVGAPFKYVTVATNNPLSFGATGLPNGLNIAADTGVISGTPLEEGEFEANLAITNSSGTSNVSLMIIIKSSKAIITKVTSNENANTLNWEPLAGLQFRVERSESPAGPFTVLSNVETFSFTDENLGDADVYYYRIVSLYDGEDLAVSDVVEVSAAIHQFAYYNFDEEGGTTIVDLWNGHDGTLMSAAQRTAGQFENAITFNGSTNSFATLPQGIVSSITDFTISSWVRLDSKSRWMRVFDFGSGTGTYMFLSVQGTGGDVRYAIRNEGGTEQSIDSGYDLPLDTWTHIAVTQSGETCTIYINGTQAATATISLTPEILGATTQNYLGKSQWNDPLLRGTLDDFKIFDRALSDTEIASEMKASQILLFEPLGDILVSESGFTLNAEASSGLSITYSSSNASVATVEGNEVQIKGLGTTVITATQAGSTSYKPVSKSQILNVVESLSSETGRETQKLIVVPNPAVDRIYVFGLSDTENFGIYSVSGQLVHSGRVSDQGQIDLSTITNGIYFLKLENGKAVKLVKQ